ncbi:MAG: response regulator [Verrucomicrobiota bacterium]|nr:response regulator [Verrucomicrobiota bacterium]
MNAALLYHAKIMIVDDELMNVRLLEKLLTREGYLNISMTTDSRDALAMFQDDQPDLILLDLNMPHINGYEVMQSLAALISSSSFLPIIVLTADVTPEAKQRALAAGAADFICKPFDNVEVTLRIRNVLRIRFLQRQLETQAMVMEERVRERTEFLQRTVIELQKVQQQVLQQEAV